MTATTLVSLTMILRRRSYGLLRPILDGPLPHEEAAVRYEPVRDRAGGEEKTGCYHCGKGGLAEMG